MRNICAQVLPAATVCGATRDRGQGLVLSLGAGLGSGDMDDKDQEPGMEVRATPGARLVQESGLSAKPGPSLDQS